MMKSINIGEPQPLPCKRCKNKEGYQYTETIRTTYTTRFDESGKVEGGDYGDTMKYLCGGKTAYCLNCNDKLPFKIIMD